MNNDLFMITNDIYNLYNNLSFDINELKDLINKENELYNYLSFDELCEIRHYYINNETTNKDISKRIINKTDQIIINNYFDEYFINNFDHLQYSKETEKSIIIYINTFKRDLFYLNIYFLNKYINKNGHLGDIVYLKNNIIKEYMNNIILKNSFIHPNIESELINNNFNFDDIYLNSNLISQLSLFSQDMCNKINDSVLYDDFEEHLNNIFSINIDNIKDDNNEIILLESLINLLSMSILDDNYKMYTEYIMACNKINTYIYDLLKDNIDNLTNDKMIIKTLSLNAKKK